MSPSKGMCALDFLQSVLSAGAMRGGLTISLKKKNFSFVQPLNFPQNKNFEHSNKKTKDFVRRNFNGYTAKTMITGLRKDEVL